MITYKIKEGDTLSAIAKKYNTTVDSIASANNIKNKNLIYTGDTINIPSPAPVVTDLGNGYTSVVSRPSYTAYRTGSSADKTSKDAQKDITNWEGKRPADYTEPYGSNIRKLLRDLLGMSFDYNIEKDPSFKSARDTTLRNAALAMEDAFGRASALTGGFGNSYAQSAANQAYGRELSSLTGMIPELYEAAYDRYSDDRDHIIDAVELLASLTRDDFSRYEDLMKLYFDEGELLWDNFKDLSDSEFDRYIDYENLLLKKQKA